MHIGADSLKGWTTHSAQNSPPQSLQVYSPWVMRCRAQAVDSIRFIIGTQRGHLEPGEPLGPDPRPVSIDAGPAGGHTPALWACPGIWERMPS